MVIADDFDFGEDHTAYLLDLRLVAKVVDEAEVVPTRAVLRGPSK